MGNESSSSGCDHGGNSDLRYDHHRGDSLATTHYKNEVNAALDRAESFSPSGGDALSSSAQSFVDAHTLKNAEKNIAPGCGKCKDSDNKNDKKDKKEKKEKKDKKHHHRDQDTGDNRDDDHARDDRYDAFGGERSTSPGRSYGIGS